VNGQVVLARHAQKYAKKLAAAGLKPKAQELLKVLADAQNQHAVAIQEGQRHLPF
jgi:hypothetical protein